MISAGCRCVVASDKSIVLSWAVPSGPCYSGVLTTRTWPADSRQTDFFNRHRRLHSDFDYFRFRSHPGVCRKIIENMAGLPWVKQSLDLHHPRMWKTLQCRNQCRQSSILQPEVVCGVNDAGVHFCWN